MRIKISTFIYSATLFIHKSDPKNKPHAMLIFGNYKYAIMLIVHGFHTRCAKYEHSRYNFLGLSKF